MNLKKMLKKAQSKVPIVDAMVNVILIVALIPIIVTFSAPKNLCLNSSFSYLYSGVCNNISSYIVNATGNISATSSLTTTEVTLLGLIALFIVLAFIFNLIRTTGLVKKK